MRITHAFHPLPALLRAVAWLGLCGPIGAASAKTAEVTIADSAALQGAAEQARAQPAPTRYPRHSFLAAARIRDVSLSPDGRQLAWLDEQSGRVALWRRALPEGQAERLLPRTDARELAWSRDGRWLLLPGRRQVAMLPVAGQRGGGALTSLKGASGRDFLFTDPTQPAAILVRERLTASGRWRVLRIGIPRDETVLIEHPRRIVDIAVAPSGHASWVLLAVGESHELHKVIDTGRTRRVLVCGQMRRCQIVAHAADGGVLLWGNPSGDLHGLMHVDASGKVHEVQRDPAGEADLAEVTVDPQDGRPRLLGWRSTIARQVALEAADSKRLTQLQRRLAGRDLRISIGMDRWLVQEKGDVLRGSRWWLLESNGSLLPALRSEKFWFAGKPVARPETSAMSAKRPLRWRASDGRWLHGFVHLPRGVDATRAPMVVIVHGGPYSLVRPDFSNDAQFLANRGYVVFQPNFRGSTGLGRDYMLAAAGDFGRGRVLQDIVEGTQGLLRIGIGDPRRVGIIGASFGGYAALLAATFEPGLFQVAVAGVPPTDFGFVMREYLASGHEMFPGIPMAASMRHLGTDPHDAALMRRLRAQSPLANPDRLRRPVLIVAGGLDERVPIRAVAHYAAELKLRGKDISLYIDDQAGHAITDELSREAYYYLMESMLHRHLQGPRPSAPGLALRKHLLQHLRLRGEGLMAD